MSKLPAHLQPSSNKRISINKEIEVTRQIRSGALDLFKEKLSILNEEIEVKRQPRSGAGELEKGDIATEDDLIEYKFTNKNSFRLTKGILDKLKDESIQMGKENSYIIIDIGGYRIIGKVDKL